MLYFEFAFLLLMLYLGSRFGGIGLGVVSGIGLVVEVFLLRMPPTKPPIVVIMIIIAVVTCTSVLEAAGGLKYMLQIAERILRRHPKRVTLLAPLITYTMTVLLGTGHAVYAIMPVIGDVALRKGIRPERPMAAASVACQLAITGSPISAAVVYYLAKLSAVQPDINLLRILTVTIPGTLGGTLLLSLYSLRRGKDLTQDRAYQRRLKDPVWSEKIRNASATTLDEHLPASARQSVIYFLITLAIIVLIALWPEIRTVDVGGTETAVSMSAVVQMLMLASGGFILLATRTPVSSVPQGTVFRSGMVAVIAIFGIAWMSDTYFQHAMPSFKQGITLMIQTHPWTFALALFAVSVVINSQAATARMLLPVGMAMGLTPHLLIALMPATYAYFFIPNYPTDIATANFDVTGTTKIGKYYFNHSFMLPGLIGVIGACCIGYAMSLIVI